MHLSLNPHQHELANSSESNQRIYDFLKANPIGVLATVDPDGNPHAAVIYFSINNEFKITFTTKSDTKKHDNLKLNNHVMLVAYEASTQTTVQVTGVTKDISDTPEAEDAFKRMVQTAEQTSESGVPPITKLFAGDYQAYQLNPVQIRMAIFARPEQGGYDMYETIDFKG